MITVSDATKQLYLESSHKTLTITFPNRNITLTNLNIVQESPELTEILEPDRQLSFTGCNSSTFKFKVAGLLQDVRDEYVEVTIQAGNTDVIPLFSGYVVSQNNRTFEDVVTEVECQDILYKLRDIDVMSWYSGLSSSITLKNFRNSFFTYIGLEQVVDINDDEATGDLINDDLTITKMDTAKMPKVLNAGDVMRYICQINGRYGQIGRDKKFHYRELVEIIKGLYPSYETFPSPTTYPSDENARVRYNLQHYSKINYEPYEVEVIDCVTIRDNEGKSTRYSNTTNITNEFVISDNLLASSLGNNKVTACQRLYGLIGKVWYIPLTLNCIGFPWIECGDIILTRTKRNIVRSYMFQRTLKGLQALLDTITVTGEQYREKYVESEATGVSTNRAGVYDNYLRVHRIETNDLVAQMVSTEKLSAKYIKGGGGSFGYLEADCIQANTISVDKLTGSIKDSGNTWEINLSNGTMTIGSISANKISGGTISASVIGAGSIKAEKLDASSFSSWELAVQKLSCTTLYVGGPRYVATSVTIGGQGYTILAQA